MQCLICNENFDSTLKLSKHLKYKHKLSAKQYYITYVNDGICKICGKPTRFVNLISGFKTYCSTKCAMSDSVIREKVSQKTKEATENIKQHNLAKYGVEWTTQLDSQKEKSRKTSLIKYGTEHPMQNTDIQKKRNNSTLEHLGVEFAAQSKEVQNKIKETNIEKYGVDCPLQQENVRQCAIKNAWNDEARQKRIKTTNDRYGVNTNLQRPEVKTLAQTDEAKKKRSLSTRETILKKYGVMCAYNIPEIQAKAHSDEVNQKRILSTRETLLTKYNVKCAYNIPTIQAKAIKNSHTKEANEKRVETLHTNGGISSSEQLFIELAKLYNVTVDPQHYDSKYPYLCDFYIPEKDLYVELHIFWTHNDHFYTGSKEDLDTVNYWKSKNNSFYNNAIYTWTDLDVRKRQIAKDNNLNYVVLWSDIDIDIWFALGCPIGRDWEQEYSWLQLRELEAIDMPTQLTQQTINKIIKHSQFNVFYARELQYWNSSIEHQIQLYKNRFDYLHKTPNQLSDLEILRGLNISGKIRAYTIFNNIGLNQFIEKYKVDAIYDPCAGWGERLLTCALHNIDYYGFDINKNLDTGYQEIIDTFDLTQEYNSDIQDNIRHYNTLFTCPPYWNTEVYSTNGAENLSYEDFLLWWKNIVHKSNCVLVAYQINQKYKNDMNQQLLNIGYDFIEEIILPTRSSHFNRKNGINNKTEYESIQIFKHS